MGECFGGDWSKERARTAEVHLHIPLDLQI